MNQETSAPEGASRRPRPAVPGLGSGLLLLAALSIDSGSAWAQGANEAADDAVLTAAAEPVRLARAARVEVGPVIDGYLDEAVWTLADPLAGFVQREPVLGAPVSERTEIRILFDDDALYIGAWLYDREPDRIIIGERRRNANLNQSDAFLVVLDTYSDRQNGFAFGTNPGGIQYDGQVRGEGRLNTNWNGNWTVATSRDGAGWYVEMRIPFSTLRYGPGDEQSWGLNMGRYIGRKNEQAFWSEVPRQFGLFRLTEAGMLAGVRPPPRRVTEITPYVLGGAHSGAPGQLDTEYPFDAGADLKLGITRSLALDLTFNTDFAQVEVDDQQVDLTRFSLFFPERRPFFLENADLFAVVSGRAGASPTPAQLFHSRRIGVHRGREVPIRGGARVTGRVGGTDVGLVYMRTRGLDGVQHPNGWTVARLARELPGRSRIGGIFTSRVSAEDSGDYNRMYALDARLGIGREWTFDVVAGLTETPGLEGDERLLLVAGEYRDQDWQLSAHYDHIGEHFNPEVGFVRRVGYREGQVRAMRYVRMPGVEWVRELRPHVRYSAGRDPFGFKETETLHLHTHIAFERGGLIGPALDYQLDGLSEPFRIAGTSIEVPPGTYAGWTAWSMQNTNSAAPVSLNSRVEVGSFLTGDRVALSGGISFRQGGTLSGSVNVNHNRIRLPEGEFNTTLTRLRLRYAFSPSVSLQSSVQYSDQTGIWTGHVRFGWLDAAGTGLFLVYNERHLMEVGGISGILPRDGLERPERTFVVKLTRQLDMARIAQTAFN